MAPLRILHVVEATFAGVGRHVLDLVEGQAERGHEVFVVYSEMREDEAFRNRRTALSGVSWHRISTPNRPSPRDIAVVRRIVSLCAGYGIEIMHGHSTKGGLLARLAGLRSHAKVVYTPNAFYSMNPALSRGAFAVVARAEAILSKSTDAVVVVSPEEEMHAKFIGIAAGKLFLIPNGIPDVARGERSSVRAELGLPHRYPIVGFVGRLDAQKSPMDLIAVYRHVSRRHDEARFVVIGDGPMRSACEALSDADDELRHRCHWLGSRPGFRSMAALNVFLLPSRYEGFPYVLVEAARNRLPIVTTTTSCATSIVREGENGFICTSGDVTAMGDAVLRILNDGAFREAAGGVSANLSNEFTVARMADSVERLYRHLV